MPSELSLRRLHDVFQAAMLWCDQHPYEFLVGDRRYGDGDPSDHPGVHQAGLVTVSTVVARAIDCFLYRYDFGDDWRHEVLVEDVRPSEPGIEYPLFVEGARRGPPEGVGGAQGYQSFLAAVTDPHHPQHEEAVWWYGGEYDPDDLEEDIIRIQLNRIAASWRGGIEGRGNPKAARQGG